MISPFKGLSNIAALRPSAPSVNPHSGFSVLRNTPRTSTTPSNPAPYSLGQVGVPSVTRTSVGPFDPANIDMLRPSNRRDAGNAATYGINPDIIAGSEKSQWELDDDTADFLTDAFNTLNQEDEALGGDYGGGSGGGGSGGGGGPGFAGGPGTQHATTWSFGNRPAFTPKGIF